MTGKKILNDITSTFKHPTKHPVRLVAIVGGVYLLGDYIISAKGNSTLAKTWNKIVPPAHAKHVAPPPPRALPAAPPGGPAAAHAAQAAAKGYFAGGPFGPGWGRGNMPYMYGSTTPVGGRWQETPSDISIGHRGWASASGQYPEYWNQSTYPWA